MIQLRDYQLEAVNACAQALTKQSTALIVAATGAGKALIAAELCRRILERNPSWRVLVLCYVQEILQSNYDACKQLGINSVGIYCAAMGRRDAYDRVIHASRDSLGRDPLRCGNFTVVIIDEVHMLSEHMDSRYQRLLQAINPKYTIGLTATPFRLDGGYIYGKRKMFPSVAYEISHQLLVKRGFLVPYVLPTAKRLVDTSGVKVVQGDYDSSAVDNLVNNEQVIDASISEWEKHAEQRQLSLFFCHSISHGKRCFEAFRRRFPKYPAAFLDGTTDKETRLEIIEKAKALKLKAVFNVSVLTTGTNIPAIDCVVWLRPTASTVLFVQGCGRASRLHPNKKDAMILDLVGNMETFGSADNPTVRMKSSSKKKREFSAEEYDAMGIDPKHMKGKVPIKSCPQCKTEVAAPARTCDHCGYLFITMRQAFTTDNLTASVQAVIKTEAKRVVTGQGEPALLITYTTETDRYKEWILYRRSYEKLRYLTRLELLKTDTIKYLRVTPNLRNPNFPKLEPLCQNPTSSDCASDG